MSAAVLAVGAISALGRGHAAYRLEDVGEAARVFIARDKLLEEAHLTRPFLARASLEAPFSGQADRATGLLLCAFVELLSELDEFVPQWRKGRIGLSVGTSSGGMLSAEQYFTARADGVPQGKLVELGLRSTYCAPLEAALAELDLPEPCQRTSVLAACAASTIAIGIGLRWLDRDACDLVIAGGYDAVSTFVASGFEGLRATTASEVRPFRVGRDGMCLGEGAALVALSKTLIGNRPPRFYVSGFGASNDAVHVTAPDRTGTGVVRATEAAIREANIGLSEIGLVSVHGTATPFNDAMEARALARVFGEGRVPPVHPFKAQVGHTLGAAGVLEALAAADAMTRGVIPSAAGSGEMDRDAMVPLLSRSQGATYDAVLKSSSAFGGTNASLVLSRHPTSRRPRTLRPVYLRAAAQSDELPVDALAKRLVVGMDRLGRLDVLCRLGLSAMCALSDELPKGALSSAGLVVGHAFATIETNERYHARLREKGAALVNARLFPATSPNAIVGECCIAFQMTGPSFSVGGGLDRAFEAVAAAWELVASGDADRMVALVVDEIGPVADALGRAASTSCQLRQGGAGLLLVSEPLASEGSVSLDEIPVSSSEGQGGQARVWRWLIERGLTEEV